MPALPPPPSRVSIASQNGAVINLWQVWFQKIAEILGNEPIPVAAYTVATAPSAATHTGHMIYVSDEAGGATMAFSDGTDWRRVQDRAVIS